MCGMGDSNWFLQLYKQRISSFNTSQNPLSYYYLYSIMNLEHNISFAVLGLKTNNKTPNSLGTPLKHIKRLKVQKKWCNLMAMKAISSSWTKWWRRCVVSCHSTCMFVFKKGKCGGFWTGEKVFHTRPNATKGASFWCHYFVVGISQVHDNASNHHTMQWHGNGNGNAFQHAFWVYSILDKLEVTLTAFFFFSCHIHIAPNATPKTSPNATPKHPRMPPKTSHHWKLGLYYIPRQLIWPPWVTTK